MGSGFEEYFEKELISTEKDLKGILGSIEHTRVQTSNLLEVVESFKDYVNGSDGGGRLLGKLEEVEKNLIRIRERLAEAEEQLRSAGRELENYENIEIDDVTFNKDFPQSDYQSRLEDMERLLELSNSTLEKVEEDSSATEARKEFLHTLSQLTEVLEGQNQLEEQDYEEIVDLMEEVRESEEVEDDLIRELLKRLETSVNNFKEIAKTEVTASEDLSYLISNEIDLLKSLKKEGGQTPLTVQNLSRFGGEKGLNHVLEGEAENIVLSRRKDYSKEESIYEDVYERNQELNYLIWDGKKRTFVMDHHNYALMAWNAAFNSGLFHEKADLVHIDNHRDYEEPNFYPEDRFKTIEQAEKYVKSVGIERFIKPAERQNIIGNVINLQNIRFANQARELLHFFKKGNEFIFDLDLDFFHASANKIEIENHYRILAFLTSKSSLTTIALSPKFINQREAKKHLEKILDLYGKVSEEDALEILIEWAKTEEGHFGKGGSREPIGGPD